MYIVGHLFITVFIICSRNMSNEAEDIHTWIEK